MDSQSVGILLISLVFISATLIGVLQYAEAKQREKKLKKDLEVAQAPLKGRHSKNHESTPNVKNNQTGTIVSERHQPHVYRYQPRHNNTIKEIAKIRSKPEDDFIFLDTETSSLDNPYVIDIAIVSITGSVLLSSNVRYEGVISKQSQAVHGISTTNKPSLPLPTELEDDLVKLLKGKTVIAYNAKFDLKALRTTFTSPKMVSLINELDNNSICMMNTFQELFRPYKRKSLLDACDQFGITRLPAHNSKNDALMVHSLYIQLKPLFSQAEKWMLGFEDIHWKSLNLPDGTVVSYWSSSDKQRQVLYSPSSNMGSGKVAELSDELKLHLESYGEVSFIVSNNNGIPNIVMSALSHKKAQENRNFDARKRHEDYINQLLNPKMPTKGKLRLYLSLDCREANRKRLPPLNSTEIYRPYLADGDVLTITSLKFTSSFNFKDVQFIDSTGQSCGHLLNINKEWTRVFGILMKGYTAEVHVIDTSKRLKVDVFFRPCSSDVPKQNSKTPR